MQHTCTHNTLVHVDYYRSSNRKYQAAYDARMYLPQVTDKNVNSVNKETFPSFAVWVILNPVMLSTATWSMRKKAPWAMLGIGGSPTGRRKPSSELAHRAGIPNRIWNSQTLVTLHMHACCMHNILTLHTRAFWMMSPFYSCLSHGLNSLISLTIALHICFVHGTYGRI